MIYTNKHNLPEAVFKAVTSDSYQPGSSDYSATTLLKPPRIVQLERRYWGILEQDAIDRVWSLFGQACHYVLEQHADDDAVSEERLYVTVHDRKIGGQVDHYHRGVISDYKVTSAWSIVHGSKFEDWEIQLNIYAYIFRKNGYEVNKLQIITIPRDWDKHKARQDPSYPQTPLVVYTIPLWSLEKQEQFILNKVHEHILAEDLEDTDLPCCTAEEMWEQPTKYAVMKKDAKRATRVFDDKAEAEAFRWEVIGGSQENLAYVQERRGRRTRCLEYCPVAGYCSQYKEYIG